MTKAARRRRKQEKAERLEGNDGQRKLEHQVATLNYKGEHLNDLFLNMAGRLGMLCSVFGGLLLYNAFNDGRAMHPASAVHDGLTIIVGIIVKLSGGALYSGNTNSVMYLVGGGLCACAQTA